MKLKELPVFLLDCQTTGMRPPAGRILEIAWSVTNATEETSEVESYLVSLPEGESVPYRVRELTGITDEEMSEARPLEEVFSRFSERAREVAVIHYAQFEKPFLADLFGGEIPFEVVCTHALIKRLFPDLPSMNIRGAAGFFGDPIGAIKRADSHVKATHRIWRGLVAKLEQDGVTDLEGLRTLLAAPASKKKAGRYTYRLDRARRLELPDQPGVYRMLAKTGEVLYVGKATSLKSRVNSYFRGKAGRDRRKLEMLAQVWDLNVTACKTALEAALLEADEIKRFNPPYNVVMKRGRRHLVFYSRDFSSVSREQNAEHPIGPFRNSNWIEHLRLIEADQLDEVFYDPPATEVLRAGWELFREVFRGSGVRDMLAFGLRLPPLVVEETEEEETEEEEDREYTPEEVAAKFERLFRRAADEYRRAREMTRLLDARVVLMIEDEERVLDFASGTIGGAQVKRDFPWSGLDIDTFDRISVLLSELRKYEYRVEVPVTAPVSDSVSV